MPEKQTNALCFKKGAITSMLEKQSTRSTEFDTQLFR